ncbi:HNH endonuclease [Lacticaseibacillus sp. 866-1]|uniref:HNH endonuclease n=1 Tax=Lacticaseibacillus sp. 866-1 TaxID=2799576 RepID=UPI0019441B66|nr:HNH endonuclease [Lacticaseibacillus sp. 866-1]
MTYRSNRKHKKIVHECGEPLCHKIVSVSKRYCDAHQQQHEAAWQEKKDEYRRSKLGQAIRSQKAKRYDDTERDKEAAKFYNSKQWRSVRDYVYARDMAVCQSCGNVVTDRKVIDHIIPLRICDSKQALDSANLWTLCYRCHTRKTSLEQIISKQTQGDNKLRHLDRKWWAKVLNEKKEDYIQ